MSRPVQEEDVLPTASIVGAIVAAVILTLVCLLWVWLVIKPFTAADLGTAAPLKAAARAPAPTPVDQVVFSAVKPYSAERMERQRRQLDSYGVVDQDKGVVRIPIRRAMELVAAGRAP